jgi:tRNA G46 methylase TrmB
MAPKGRSRTVSSSQNGVHPRLEGLLSRRQSSHWSQPLHAPTVQAFLDLQDMLQGEGHHLVLDSGCGTGESTRQLAESMLGHVVLGVDKSLARLSRTGAPSFPYREGNIVWMRAELATFWRLAVQAGWHLRRHYLLYPNPWPKPGALQKRWHAHPVFPDLLRLGGRLEMRCNWGPYAEEFALTVNRLLDVDVKPVSLPEEPAISPFERKYRASGHRIYSVVVSCDSSAV